MRNDDYETIVFKVLLHQYGLLKRKITFEADTFDRYIDKENIAPGYFADALHMMQDDYLIEGLTFGQAWGKDTILTSDLENARITSMGIYHLTGDETMIKLRERACTTPRAYFGAREARDAGMKTPSAKARIGRQTPTTAFVLPYEKTCGVEAVELYNSTGRAAQEWQELLLYDLLAENADGLWTHTKFGYSVPRRNGKNEVVAMRELYGIVKRGEHILHTAHRTTTTHSAWERLLNLLAKANIPVASSYRAFGKEHIELENGGKVEFRTRTSKGGLGEGFDLLVIDEAQEYQDDQESALKYVVTDSQNPQTVFCGTPPTPVSSGKVFVNFRAAVLQGKTQNSAWEEWGVEHETDPNDREAWYETNPSLGTVFTERSIADEIGSDTVDFNIQRLGLWISYNQKSAISRNEWDALKLSALPPLSGKLFVGIKYGHDGESVALSVAVRTGKKIFVEALDCRSVRGGNAWIMKFLASAFDAIETVVVDGANGQELLSAKMKRAGLRAPTEPSVKQIITANAAFEQAIFSGTICHMGQPSLTQAAANCEKRAIGSAGGFGYRSIREGVDIALLDSVILAHSAATEGRRKRKKQKVNY